MAGTVWPYMIVDRASELNVVSYFSLKSTCSLKSIPRYHAGTEPYQSSRFRQECGDSRFQSEGNSTLGDGQSTTSRDDFPTRTGLIGTLL